MSNGEERREYPRAKVNWPVTLITSEAEIAGEIENFTPKGLFITCKEAPPLEETLRIVIKIPGHQTMNVAVRVIWSSVHVTSEGETRLGVGIQFTEISKTDLQFLHEAMSKYQKA